LILEQATGRSCAEELHERVLDPLGLTDTFYAATEPVLGGTADVYHMVEGEAVNVSATHLSALGAGGGMVSTTRDLAQFANALLGGELLRPETMSAMLTFVPTIWPGAEWGLGVMRVETPFGPIIGHE
jgi:D-alanyl-D-alanine carboxypeptidase